MLIIISFAVGSLVGLIFGYKVGKFAGRRAKAKATPKPKPMTFDEMMLQASKMPTGDAELAADVDFDIERQLREANL